jgi:hypothetical protein
MSGLNPLTQALLYELQSTTFAALQSLSNVPSLASVSDGQGSPLGALFYAQSLLGLQGDTNVQYVNLKARLATSFGADVDTFVNQFGVYRDAASIATESVSFAPNSSSSTPQVIPVGALCQDPAGLQFQVLADGTQSAYQSGVGYVIPAGSSAAITLTLGCSTAGTIGNIQAGTALTASSGLGQLTFPSGTITVGTDFDNGTDGETDAALKARFATYFASGRWGTKLAIVAAIESAQTLLTFQIGECLNTSNATQYGYFTVFVNTLGQSAGASSTTLAAVTAAIAPIKACGIQYVVASPSITTVPCAATLILDEAYIAANPGTTGSTISAAATSAYDAYVNSIGLSYTNSTTLLSYARVSSVLVNVPGVANISSFTLNSGTSDITAAYGYQIVAGTTTFTTSG